MPTKLLTSYIPSDHLKKIGKAEKNNQKKTYEPPFKLATISEIQGIGNLYFPYG